MLYQVALVLISNLTLKINTLKEDHELFRRRRD